ncbi:membrane dipeptidase [Sphingopyxis sp. Root214]|uniref:dipeptidase n=1 Tax=unclassified Sphingopyxis TaxID=2614943 RepID=UPI0007014DD1|nr:MULTISPECIES: dipeptidase [unclassified Sphingopyxis]KQZ76500.1 membrane dipeptidase [Sphingopyxis sp. Root154]KRC09613.1 membrane dipeptidase [Sphingopyxis sp. Root214]
MTRTWKAALLAGALLIAPAVTHADAGDDEAVAVHDRVLVLDSHADVLLPSTPKRYYLDGRNSRVDFPRLEQGGVDAIVLAVAVGPGPRDAAGVAAARREADEKLARIKAFAASDPARVGLARSAADVERLSREGKVAVLVAFQNARSIGKDIAQIDRLYSDGVRIFAFDHAGHNDFADSSRPQPGEPVAEHRGLSPLGRQAVAKLNDLGVLIDVSQLSTDALLQTVTLSRAPVAATHSAARALVDNGRNLDDAELDAIRAKGGVVQVTPFTSYLTLPDQASRDRISAIRASYGLPADYASTYDGSEALPEAQRSAYLDALSGARTKASLSDFVDHIDYIAKRIGWQHVGIGSDFDHGAGVAGFDSAADAPNVTRELLRRGYSEDQIAAIWGGNFLRALRAAEGAKKRQIQVYRLR